MLHEKTALGFEPRAFSNQGKCSTAEPYCPVTSGCSSKVCKAAWIYECQFHSSIRDTAVVMWSQGVLESCTSPRGHDGLILLVVFLRLRIFQLQSIL